MDLKPEIFEKELAEAVKNFDKHIVCLEKSTGEFQAGLVSLAGKAIKAYLNRGPGLRHGIALDKQVTVIISQTDAETPVCGIYFNLSSPYKKKLPS